MVCNNCGSQVPDGSNICPFCGNPVVSSVNDTEEFTFGSDTATQSGSQYINQPQAPVRKTSAKLLWILFGGILILRFFSVFALVGEFIDSVDNSLMELQGGLSGIEREEKIVDYEDEAIYNEDGLVTDEKDDAVSSSNLKASQTIDGVKITAKEVYQKNGNTYIDLEVSNSSQTTISVDGYGAKLVVDGDQYEPDMGFEEDELVYEEVKSDAKLSGFVMYEGLLDVNSGDKLYIAVLDIADYSSSEFELVFE